MSSPDAELPRIDAEIERLRQARPKDEADPKCVEIDTGITGLQWLREKLVNSSGPQVMTGIGDQGQRCSSHAREVGKAQGLQGSARGSTDDAAPACSWSSARGV